MTRRHPLSSTAFLPGPFIRGMAVGLASVVAMAVPAAATSVAGLVAERAALEAGPGIPSAGYYDVTVAEGLVQDGQYLREFWMDDRTGQFIANVVTDSGDVRRVWGLATLTVPVPVPTRRVQPDEILSELDFQLVDMPYARVGPFAVLELDSLHGMQVRRMLTPGRPVQHQSVVPPIVVSRGEKVVIELRYGAMRLSANGKAITDAHLGQEVRVVNLSSNKTIVAVATGDGIVEVNP